RQGSARSPPPRNDPPPTPAGSCPPTWPPPPGVVNYKVKTSLEAFGNLADTPDHASPDRDPPQGLHHLGEPLSGLVDLAAWRHLGLLSHELLPGLHHLHQLGRAARLDQIVLGLRRGLLSRSLRLLCACDSVSNNGPRDSHRGDGRSDGHPQDREGPQVGRLHVDALARALLVKLGAP